MHDKAAIQQPYGGPSRPWEGVSSPENYWFLVKQEARSGNPDAMAILDEQSGQQTYEMAVAAKREQAGG